MTLRGWEPFEEAVTLPSFRQTTREGSQLVPVNIYETDVDLVIAAPMPGLRPEDIEVTVTDRLLTIRSGLRGTVEDNKDYIRHEWHYGPYSRTVDLPFPVDADKANATYGNGVLMLMIPKAKQTTGHRIKITETGPARGETAQHSVAEFSPETHRHLAEHKINRGKSTG